MILRLKNREAAAFVGYLLSIMTDEYSFRYVSELDSVYCFDTNKEDLLKLLSVLETDENDDCLTKGLLSNCSFQVLNDILGAIYKLIQPRMVK